MCAFRIETTGAKDRYCDGREQKTCTMLRFFFASSFDHECSHLLFRSRKVVCAPPKRRMNLNQYSEYVRSVSLKQLKNGRRMMGLQPITGHQVLSYKSFVFCYTRTIQIACKQFDSQVNLSASRLNRTNIACVYVCVFVCLCAQAHSIAAVNSNYYNNEGNNDTKGIH